MPVCGIRTIWIVEDCAIEASKNFRRCEDLTLSHVSIPNAEETLWNCQDVVLNDVMAKGDYFAMNSKDMKIDGLTLYGNYSVVGVKNVETKFQIVVQGRILEQ